MGPWERRFAVEEGAARGRSVSRLNVLIATTAAIISLIYGYDLGSIASAFLFLVPDFDLSTFMTSVVTSAEVLGQLFGALFAWRISNTIGRKRSLALVSFAFVYALATKPEDDHWRRSVPTGTTAAAGPRRRVHDPSARFPQASLSFSASIQC